MGSIGLSRVRRDFRNLWCFKTAFWDANPRDNDIFMWDCSINPVGTQEIKLTLELPPDWPLRPPKIKFVSRVYHPCISTDGYLELFQDDWSSAFSVGVVMLCVTAMFNEEGDARRRVTDRTMIFEGELIRSVLSKVQMCDI